MKKIISLTLAGLMLVILLLSTASCAMESMTGYTRLRDHLTDTVGLNKAQKLEASLGNLSSASLSVGVADDSEEHNVRATAYALTQGYVLQITLIMNGSVEKATVYYQVLSAADASVLSEATATVLLTQYTGNELVVFDSVKGISAINEPTQRQNATSLLNSLLITVDTYLVDQLNMRVTDLGFIALSDKYMANVEEQVTEEDLGGMFSAERWAYAGTMLIQGIGMVFLVLAILWMILLIFKKVFYKNPNEVKKDAKAPAAPAVVEAASAVEPATDSGELIAVITAAVAAAIESDPALTSQFAGGFRVVSFKKTESKSRNR